MPRVKVNGRVKHFPYTTKGRKAAATAAAKKRKPKTKKKTG